MYIMFLLFSMLMEIINPSTIKIDNAIVEHSYWISVGCRFAITCTIYGFMMIFQNLYDTIKFLTESYRKYKKSIDFM